jgi:hypothetical protein
MEAVVEEVLDDGAHVRGVGGRDDGPLAVEMHREPVLFGERRYVVGERSDEAIEGDGLELGLAEPAHRPEDPELGEGAIGLDARAIDERAPLSLVAGDGELVEQEAERVERIVELVEHRRDEHPNGLVALDLEEARPQSVGAPRRLFGS